MQFKRKKTLMECTEEYIESAIKPIRTLLSDQKCIFEGCDSNTK